MAAPNPSSIGPYRVEQLLGRGGMGAVYKAIDSRNGAQVALKVVHPELAREGTFLERFRREGRLGQAVRHANVVALLEAGEANGVLYLAFEVAAAGSLKDRLAKEPLPWREAAAVGAGIARGLAAIHGAGLVHRDLKPENVLLGADGRPKIADLGLARRTGAGAQSQALTRSSEMLGTFEYMAPEQADSAKTVGPPADLYALGATLHALVSGRPPFEGQGMELVTKHLTEVPAALSSLVPGVPRELDALVLRLLAKQPAERGGSASEVARELDAIAKMTAPARRAGALVAGGFLLVAALGGSAFYLAPKKEAPPPPPPPAPPPVTTPEIDPVLSGTPAWFRDLEKAKRPSRLPDGIACCTTSGEYVNGKDGSILVFVPGRTFSMGRNGHGVEYKQHQVKVGEFFIGKYEVTVAQFERFMAAKPMELEAHRLGGGSFTKLEPVHEGGGRENVPNKIAGSYWKYPRGPEAKEASPDEPVTMVTWDEAMAYCKWAGLVLPTEAEWELAAGDGGKDYTWGSEADESRANVWPADEGPCGPVWSVGSETSIRARSWCGAIDMSGNVFEWCYDYYAKYLVIPGVDPDVGGPKLPEDRGKFPHSTRGGSFRRHIHEARAWQRNHNATEACLDDQGFRVAYDFERKRTIQEK